MTALACSDREKHAPHDWGIEFESEGEASSTTYHCPGTASPTRRGTSNRDVRGGTPARRARRAWLLSTYASDVPGFCRCYRCGGLLYNPDDMPVWIVDVEEAEDGTRLAAFPDPKPEPGEPRYTVAEWVRPLTVDRIIPGCQGGTYVRTNIRPACGGCNSETGGRTRGKVARK